MDCVVFTILRYFAIMNEVVHTSVLVPETHFDVPSHELACLFVRLVEKEEVSQVSDVALLLQLRDASRDHKNE